MDPNAALKRIREIYEEVNEHGGNIDDLSELAELCHAIDEWIVCGGFLPEAWKK